jgi:hypothetical protein
MSTIDERKFDQLVDGELTDDQRRDLLASLDDMPGGWRRCALAFLEAQAWTDEFGELLGERTSEPPAAASTRGSWKPRRWGAFFAVAASVLVAFALGAVLRDAFTDRDLTVGPDQRGMVASLPSEVGPAARVENQGEAARPGVVEGAPRGSGGWHTVTLAVDQGPEQEPELVQIPVRQWDDVDDPWPEGLAPAVPPQLLEGLKRAGVRFRQDRRLVPIRLEDGRQLVLPVDQVEVGYDGLPVIH